MNKTQEPIQPSLLVQSEGWNSSVDAHLLRASEPWQESPQFSSHGHVLRRLFADSEPEDLAINAVLFVDGRLTVCVKDARALSPPEVEDFRRRLWNLGASTLLVIETRNDVQVYSTVAKPDRKDHEGNTCRLSNETISNIERAALAIQICRLVRRVETGAIYREYTALFKSHHSVNRQLLENLRSLRNLIVRSKTKAGYQRAHAFIGRFLFSCYLLDRGIVGPPYLRKIGLPEADDMLDLLGKLSSAPRALDTLFGSLQREFNGSLLGDLADDYTVRQQDILYLQRFLSGENLRTGQLALFKLYDFSFIPIELISSIYEDFLGTEEEAETRIPITTRSRAHGQRMRGAYYTPPQLAELAVDIATDGWSTLLDKRCLDPACGSGIFLVILFIRMAEEWRKRNPNARTRTRYEALLRILSENLCGIDIHITACLVSCFSLYLAFLDQMKPREIRELRDALKHEGNTKLLPRILWEKDKRPPSSWVVRERDFFEYQQQEEFNLVIGNPPWVSRRAAPSIEHWLFSSQHNPWADEAETKHQHQTLFPAKEWATAFMWKAGLHVGPHGRVCQVLPSRVFLSNNTDRFQSLWLRTHTLESVWLLADWRFILFPNADCPCFIGRYHPSTNGDLPKTFEFITPKVEQLDPREGTIPVLPEDRKSLSQSSLIVAAKQGQAVVEWKRRHWGTARDLRLLDRLLLLPRINRLAIRPPRMTRDSFANRSTKKTRRWWVGQGFQPLSPADLEKEDHVSTRWEKWWPATHSFFSASYSSPTLILSKPVAYGDRPEFLRRTVAPELCKPPLVLVNKAFTKAFFCDYPTVFQDDFQAFAGAQEDKDLLLFLTAYFNSDLAQYLIFHTSANIGIERDIVRLEEILALPFPLPDDASDSNSKEIIISKCAEILRQQYSQYSNNLFSRTDLFNSEAAELVYEYFQVSWWERQLIEDTVGMFRPSSTPGSLDSEMLTTIQYSSPLNRREYADTLSETFQGWSRSPKTLQAHCTVADDLGLGLLTFQITDQSTPYTEETAEGPVVSILKTLNDLAITQTSTTWNYIRGFVHYESNQVNILKPLTRRHWTRTAALNDADEILTRMMEESGWRA
ncbi:MAG: hypothetical protein QOH71_4006 [Blastocatellia bacterium]|jgi:hypothetical protein|nr:hypothetical protein [Blastocatellia bacterium]